MVSQGLPIVLALSASICGALWDQPVSAQTQPMPTVAAPPRQRVPCDGPPSYPSTDPSTFSSPDPATSPSTLPNGGEGVSGPSLTGNTGALLAPNNSGPLYIPYNNPDTMAASRPLDPDSYGESAPAADEPWTWQILPTGLMYKLYLASDREPRLGTQLVHERNQGGLWDSTIGGRVGILRYGTTNDFWPQGWQLDVEAAAFPLLDAHRNLIEGDYRAGIPLTTRQGPWELKAGYVHNCSHIGDLYLLTYPGFQRINYTRDAVVAGAAVYARPDLRLYAETDWAFHTDGGAEPWEFQFGADFISPRPTGLCGAPFFAVNGHLREVNDFGGNVTVQTGWHWRGRTGHLLRIGMQYFNGMSEQGEFYNQFEEQIGGGLWYDF